MKTSASAVILFVIVVILLVLSGSSFYTLRETEQAIITQFGRPVGGAITDAGLHFKAPFIQEANIIEKRVMEWDGAPNQVPTRDKLFINVDTYARWRIHDPLLYFQRLRDERSAHSRLDDILDGETRNAVANHELIEIIRTDKDRMPVMDRSTSATGVAVINWIPIEFGRKKLAHEVYEHASKKLTDLGIELLDIRFKRINYNAEVQQKIYERMISERRQIADKFRSEGQGEAARIRGEKERDLRRIESEAYRKIQEIQGQADARATDIYAAAYNASPESYNFYIFLKTMETYQTTLDKSTMLIMSTGGDFFQFLKNAETGGKP